MSAVCVTAEDAFRAGFEADCEHGDAPDVCPSCRLTDAEIGRLAVLLRPYTVAAAQAA
ncbi:hypothetical protein [Streptomonospora sp. PA3]|uniref:hypothetical protein n=1 Tax=Streptomonospora sp. PA3 TaxID=2607326 RepID=UPI0012DEAFF6|nr:hypothetical protein [Streptomonospora sp. PA3]